MLWFLVVLLTVFECTNSPMLSYLEGTSKSSKDLLEKLDAKLPKDSEDHTSALLETAMADITEKTTKLKKEESKLQGESDEMKKEEKIDEETKGSEWKKVLLEIPPRKMWGWGNGNSGYCGSSSIQSAAIFFGNWISQDKVRGVFGPPKGVGSREVLFEEKEGKGVVWVALRNLGFRFETWVAPENTTVQHPAFLQWCKEHLKKGHPIIVGTWWKGPENEHRSDWAYDHIVPLIGFKSKFQKKYDPSDVFFWQDLKHKKNIESVGKDWVRDRSECIPSSSQDESPDPFCMPKMQNWGVAVLGNYEMENSTKIRINLPSWEEPDYSLEDRQREAPIHWNVTVTAYGLQPNKFYSFLRYNDTAFLPNGTRAGSPDKIVLVKPEKEEHEIVDEISTNSATHYRCILQNDIDPAWLKLDQELLSSQGVNIFELVSNTNNTNSTNSSGILSKEKSHIEKNSKRISTDSGKSASKAPVKNDKASTKDSKKRSPKSDENCNGEKSDDCEEDKEAHQEAGDIEKSAKLGKQIGAAANPTHATPLSFHTVLLLTSFFWPFLFASIWICHRKVPFRQGVYASLLEFEDQEC